jgi:23S rRNA pseudouridine1911/1915/1917 synthase
MTEKKAPPLSSIDSDRVLWRGGDSLAINKLPGESSEASFVITGDADERSWTAVHRLDVPVSGCLLLARNPATVHFLSQAFASGVDTGAGSVEKHYWAVIEKPTDGKKLPFGEDGSWTELTHWLAFDVKRNKSLAYGTKRINTKKALLRCRLAGKGDNYLFLEINLLTGRHHQIRAQLAACGLHIKGDLKYGARRSEKEGGIRLHASSLAFPSPEQPGDTITVKAEPPRMDPLWEAFAKALTGFFPET